MNTMHLLEAMTSIDGTLIENAMPKPKKSGRTLTRIILVAALITALTMSAFAATEIKNWFQEYFSRYTPDGLSENQIAFIDENTTQVHQSQTCNGYTIEVDSAFSDGSESIVKLRLIAPENVTLLATNFFPGNDWVFVPTGEERLTQWSGGWGCYVDDATPNMAEITCYIREPIGERTHWTMRIEDLYGTYEENIGTSDYRQWTELLVEGVWEFQIEFSNDGYQEIELIGEPIPGEVNIGLNKDSYHDVMITSFILRPMTAEITYEYVVPVHGAGDFDPIYLVMKDGSEQVLLPKSGSPIQCKYHFASPIILDDADYVRMPDGKKLPIP
jgi:hypothetical protein